MTLQAQTCPTDLKRNNGNNAAHTVYASSVSGTTYATVPSGTKQETLTVKFDGLSSSQIPVIEGAYVADTRLSVDFGPPSVPSNKDEVEFCFYGSNLFPANVFTIKFLNPSNGATWSECTFPSFGGSTVDPISVTSTDV